MILKPGKLHRLKEEQWVYNPDTLKSTQELEAGSILLYIGTQPDILNPLSPDLVFLFQDRKISIDNLFFDGDPFCFLEEVKF